MSTIIEIDEVNKVFATGEHAVKNLSLNIKEGEIIALLGPNGAGKTTLISMICGIVSPSSGKIKVNGLDVIDDYRQTRSMIGLVPQELTLESFETVSNSIKFSLIFKVFFLLKARLGFITGAWLGFLSCGCRYTPKIC